MNTQATAGLIFPVSIAGPDQSKVAGVTSVNLSGSRSFDLDGTITTYLWTQVSGPGATITTPNTVTTSITGLTDTNIYVFRLTVTDNDAQQHSDDVTITIDIFAASTLEITSTIPSTIGNGTLDFAYGEPYEVISLLFELSDTSPGDSVDFSGAQTGVLDDSHPTRTGSVTLDSSGVISKNYSGEGAPTFTCIITITSRSSSEPIPSPELTFLVFSF